MCMLIMMVIVSSIRIGTNFNNKASNVANPTTTFIGWNKTLTIERNNLENKLYTSNHTKLTKKYCWWQLKECNPGISCAILRGIYWKPKVTGTVYMHIRPLHLKRTRPQIIIYKSKILNHTRMATTLIIYSWKNHMQYTVTTDLKYR